MIDPQPTIFSLESQKQISSAVDDVLDVDIDVSPNLLVGLVTGPMLLGLMGGAALTQMIQEIGQASEELFRGDRLPLLNLQDMNQTNNTDSAGTD